MTDPQVGQEGRDLTPEDEDAKKTRKDTVFVKSVSIGVGGFFQKVAVEEGSQASPPCSPLNAFSSVSFM